MIAPEEKEKRGWYSFMDRLVSEGLTLLSVLESQLVEGSLGNLIN
jgi:hypothetical protein